MQFALQPEPFRPRPEVVEVELQVGIFNDTHRVFKIMRSARFNLHQNEVLGSAYPGLNLEDCEGLSSSQRFLLLLVCDKEDIEWDTLKRWVKEPVCPISCKWVLIQPIPVYFKAFLV